MPLGRSPTRPRVGCAFERLEPRTLLSAGLEAGALVPEQVPDAWDYWTVPNAEGRWSQVLPVSSQDPWAGYLFASHKDDPAGKFTATGAGGLKPVIGIYDAATGARLAYDDNPGGADAATVTLPVEAGRRYYFFASSRDGSAGQIEMSMELPPPDVTAAPAIDDAGVGSVVGGELAGPADIKYYPLAAPAGAGTMLLVTLYNADSTLQAAVFLFDHDSGDISTIALAPRRGTGAVLMHVGVQPGRVYDAFVTTVILDGGEGRFDLAIDFEMRPELGSLSAEPTPTIVGKDITLTAGGVSDHDGNVRLVEFYRDIDGNGQLDLATDVLLGEDANGADGWSWSGSTAGVHAGKTWFFARAKDWLGNYSAPAAVLACVTYMGDANCDGKVGIADLSALADNYGRTDAQWRHGDFTGDGRVGVADLSALADNYGLGRLGGAGLEVAGPGAVVAGAVPVVVMGAAPVPLLSALWSCPVASVAVVPLGGWSVGQTRHDALAGAAVSGLRAEPPSWQRGAAVDDWADLLEAPELTVLC